MDLMKSLNKVVNLNGYISFTQELVSSRKEIVVPFNMSTVLTLKRIRSLEVEYFSKLQESGAAFMILERMLTFPPSKTWSLLSVEIVNLLNYWLEAVRKYIITHCQSWWTFFRAVLRFISEIRRKDISVSNLILKQSAVALLDLCTSDKLTPEQRGQVVACLNQVCFHSSRDMRVALQDNCAPYLVKLASDMAASRHVPTQFAIIELLMRWLPNRQDRKVRETAAARWFPATLFKEETVAVFVERCFANFFKDARVFLNQHNSASGDVISVVCRKLTVGRLELISLADKWESWLDIVLSSGHLTAMVDVRRLPTLGLSPDLREHLTVTADNAQHVIVYRSPSQIQLSITTITQPQLTCNETQQLLDEQACDVNIWISSKCHFDTVDLALRKIFADKYKYDDNRRLSELIYSSDSNRFSASEEDTRFSHPIEIPKPRRVGCAVAPKRASGWKSPSTVSSTSLACLTRKLSAIPKLKYVKEPTGICVTPDLSCVTEISEPDDDSSYTFSGKTRPCGVLKCPKTKTRIVNHSKTSPSDNENGFSNKRHVSPVIDAKRKFTTPVSEPARRKSPIIKSDTSPNCLLSAATFGAYEASVINDTLEAIQLDDDDEVINLLAQEAFAVKEKDVLQDSGINDSDKKTPISAIETRAKNQTVLKSKTTVPCTVISKSSSEDTSASFQNVLNYNAPANKGDTGSNVLKSTTTDESNTEAINETPIHTFVNTRALSLKGKKRARGISVDSKRNFKNIGQRNLNKTVIVTEDSPKQFAANEIEDFFSHHVQENKNGDIVLSPTLARRVNETPSDTSDSFDRYLISNVGDRSHFQNITELQDEQNFVDPEDVFGCLNDIIDKVCEDLDKCAKYMEKEAKSPKTPVKITEQPVEIDSDFIPNTVSSTMNPLAKEKARNSPVKLAFKNEKAKKARVMKNKRKNAKNLSPIKKAITPEVTQENGDIEPNKVEEASPEPSKQVVAAKNVPAKRKRKLYSPKDADKQSGLNVSDTEEDNSLPADVNPKLYTPKTAATSYKDIFKARRSRKEELKYTKTTRKRGKASTSPPMSPRSMKKNEIFDKLKENVENVPIKQVDKTPKDLAVYNYTSESEDEDFKAEKTALQKTKGTPIGSTGSKRTTRSRVNYSESRNESSAEDKPVKKTLPKRKRAKQPAKPKKEVTKTIKEPIRDVIDEKMRVATKDALNTSFVLNEVHENAHDSDLEPLSKLVKRMEPIPEVSIIEEDIVKDVVEPKKAPKKRCERFLSLKKGKNKQKINVDSSANEDTSPLPPLIIEPVKTNKKDKDADSITSSKLIQSCEKVIKSGEDIDTTHNLLSDDDKGEQQVMPIELEIRQNLDTTNDDRIDICKDNTPKQEKAKQPAKEVSPTDNKLKLCKEAIVKIKREKAIFQHIAAKPSSIAEEELIEIIDHNTEAPEKSISTVGNSPIRAHGSLNEDPPNETMLNQQLNTPRDVDYDMSTSMKNFFIQLYSEININNESKRPESVQEKVEKKMVTRRNAKTVVDKKQAKEIIQSDSEDNVVPDKNIKPASASDKVVKTVFSKSNAKTPVTKKQAKNIMESESEDEVVPDKNIKPVSAPDKIKNNAKTPVTRKQAKEIMQYESEDDLVPAESIEAESPQEKFVRTEATKWNANAKKTVYKSKAQDIMQSDSEDNSKYYNSKESDVPEKVAKILVTKLPKRNAKAPATTKLTKKPTIEVIQSETEGEQEDENLQYKSQIKEIGLSSPVVRLQRLFDNLKKTPEEKPASLLSNTTSPSVVLKRLNPDDIRKWLPSPKSTLSEESREVFKVLKNTQKTLKSTDKVKTKITKTAVTKETSNTNMSVKKPEQNKSKINTNPVRRSIISPIKDFDEIDPSEPIDIQSKSITTVTKLTSPINKEKGLSNTRNITEAVASITSEISIGEQVKFLHRKPVTTPATSELSIDEADVKDVVKAIERKRRSVVEVVEPKKMRIDLEDNAQSPATSVASQWFQHALDINMETQELGDQVKAKSVLVECLQMVLEKVDTTLVDIDHNTSKKMVAFFVDMHRRSQEFANEMREFYNTKQAEHHRAMKAEAAALLRADTQKKHVLIRILREDIQAVLDHVQRTKDT